MGDGMLRSLLYAAAQVHLTSYRGPSQLRDWGLAVAERRGMKRAIIAVARKMAVILHRMWVDGTAFDPGLGIVQSVNRMAAQGDATIG